MLKEKERIEQTIKFIKWIDQYSGWWYLICTPKSEHINLRMMQLLIEKLAEEGFYEIIFVLLKVHRNEKFMDSLGEAMIRRMLINDWGKEDKDAIIKELINFFE